MSARLAVTAIHGIGNQEAGFSNRLFGHLRKHVDKRLGVGVSNDIAFGEIHWADVLEGRQATYLTRADRAGDVDLLSMRSAVVHALGDAAAYQRVASSTNSTYDEIHAVVQQRLGDLRRRAGGDVPLVVLARFNDAYARVVKRDITVDVGPFYASWTPASHSAYDRTGAFIRPVARYLGRLLEATARPEAVASTETGASKASSVA